MGHELKTTPERRILTGAMLLKSYKRKKHTSLLTMGYAIAYPP